MEEVRNKLCKLLVDNKVISLRKTSNVYIKNLGWEDKYKSVYSNNKELCDSWFSYFDTEEEAWYCLIHQCLPSDFKCIICGKQAEFCINKITSKYSKYCGKECRKIGQRQNAENTSTERYGDPHYTNPDKRRETSLNKYGVEYYSQLPESQEKSMNTCMLKYGVPYSFQSENNKTKTVETLLNKYGVDHVSKIDNVKQSIKNTKEEQYDDSNYNNPQKMLETKLNKYGCYLNVEKVQQTKEEKYGNPNYNNPEKSKETSLNKYGVEHYSQTQEYKDRVLNTNLDKYGKEYYTQTDEYKEDYRDYCERTYGEGIINAFQAEEVKEKSKNTNLNKYGVEYYSQTAEFQNKFITTNLRKYGVMYPIQNPEIHNRVLGNRGMSSPEKKIDDFLQHRRFDYQYNYDCNGKNFDFAIFKDGELKILLEIDGEYFHGLLSDYDMHHVQGDTDCERFSKVPEGVKFIVCDSMRVEECFGEILRVFDIDYEEWIQEIINSLPKDFPYPEYSDDRLRRDYKKLCDDYNLNKRSKLGDSTIRHFHKSLWHAHRSNLPSPYEAWYDKELLEKCVRNRFIYSSNLSSQAIVNGFNICKIAPKVSVFSASLAKYLIDKYLNEYDTIFDPFSGFSGRMLGTCSLNKHYIGQDINEDHVKESNEIIKFHNLNATVKVQDILKDSGGEYDCLFTCSPYGGLEHWNILNDEVEKSCDEWIDICLEKYRCKRYLFVVNQTNKYKDNIAEEIVNQSHLGQKKEYVICLSQIN